MNEIGTSVSGFNIGDYIWYIVGGVALFFIIVGFVADKSGLAKKTFSKNTKKTELPKTDNSTNAANAELKVEEPLIVTENDSSVVEQSDNNSIIVDNEDSITNNDATLDFEIPSTEEVSDEEISDGFTLDDVSSMEEMDFESEESGKEVEPTDEMTVIEPISDLQESDDEAVLDEETGIDSYSFDEEVDEEAKIETDSIATDAAEEDWGIDSDKTTVDETNLDDMELPKLEDLNTDEEDVWKF